MRQPWRRIGDGFGDLGNKSIYELTALNDYLYAATFNPDQGFQVWKTLLDADPHHWVRVVTAGGFRGKANEAAASLCVFQGAIYIGTGAQGSRRTGATQLGASGAEIIRLDMDDRLTLLVGAPRRTPRGLQWPASDLGPGFGRYSNRVVWEMVAYDGWLYAATEDASSFTWSIQKLFGSRRGRATGLFGTSVDAEAGFDLWRTRNGVDWTEITRVGFGNPRNFGAESMVATPIGLFIGTVCVPELRRLAPDDNSGCEVWLGRSD
jgi:hypothetical protein